MNPLRTTADSPLGPLTLAASDRGLCLCEFTHPDTPDPDRVEREFDQLARLLDAPATSIAQTHLDLAARELHDYFEGRLRRFTVPLHTPGTDWQRRVWQALLDLPFATTASYSQIATGLGSPGGARAVGLANAQNRVAVVVPCHRVIGADASLTGYAGGLDHKAWLLDHERAVAGESLFA